MAVSDSVCVCRCYQRAELDCGSLQFTVTLGLRAPTVVCGAQWVYSDSATYSPNTTIGASNYINLFPELKEHGLHLRVIFLLGH